MRAEGGRQKSEAKSQEPKGKTRKEEQGRKAAGEGTESETISALHVPVGSLEDSDSFWPSVSWPK